eukprot:Phypoly_transcript_03944.p1 GENE.Phypoly_transcript_03944~~Phypoly_transcript_03944.p1  ORF type:complete len:611 (+),score=126.96 Phypoly_transcript_03944:52-1833(+)
MAATELKEYNTGEELKTTKDHKYDEDDEDDKFSIGDDEEPALEANDHKPVVERDPTPNPFPRFIDSEKPPSSVHNDTKISNKETTETEKITASPTNTPPNASLSNTTSPTSNTTSTNSVPSPKPPQQKTTPNSSLPSTPTGSPKLGRQSALKTSSQLTSSGNIAAPGTPESERMVLSYNERLKMYEDVLQSDILEVHLLRELAWQGIPEAKGLRSLYWKVLLHYLPANKSLWEASLARDRKLYKDWVTELVIDPHAKNEQNHSDHPLSLDQDSKWNAYFKDNEILAEIDKDVKRTFPHLHFFNQISPTGQTIESPHYHVLKRILFIYAKLNPGIRYVQGMNELLGPIYYTFATDSSDVAFKENAEADAFFCFTNLMSEWRDNFCKTLDKSEIGVVGNMKRLNTLFKERDPELWSDLEDKKMNPQFYSFRWITLLLSQEFELPDVLRLWDSLFADAERFNFFYCFCCAMLICVRDRILDGTFADNLKLLQSYPPIDFQVIFATAVKVHENSYVPPPPRKKPETATTSHATPYTHTSVPVAAPLPPSPPSTSTSSSSSKISSLFTKSTSPPVPRDKQQEKSNIFTLPLGLGKFKL